MIFGNGRGVSVGVLVGVRDGVEVSDGVNVGVKARMVFVRLLRSSARTVFVPLTFDTAVSRFAGVVLAVTVDRPVIVATGIFAIDAQAVRRRVRIVMYRKYLCLHIFHCMRI